MVAPMAIYIAFSMLLVCVVAIVVYMYVYKSNKNNGTMENVVSVLYRQCARWAVAAEQDKSEIIAVLHANYAAGYLWAIKDIVTTDEFKRIVGEDFLEFEKKIVKIQDDVTFRLVTKCRDVVPVSDKELIHAIYGKT
ncbi:hypothetical protein [Dishui Lake large algae virus 1]|nr:hypothetical protein [Dishui Lake large algae virus 1]